MIIERTIYSSKLLEQKFDEGNNVLEISTADGCNVEIERAGWDHCDVYYCDKLINDKRLTIKQAIKKVRNLGVEVL